MVEPEAVAAMLQLKGLGWGSKRISRELGLSRGTVKRYLEAGEKPVCKKLLDGHEAWLRTRFRQHRGNADVVRQELAAEKGINASLNWISRRRALLLVPDLIESVAFEKRSLLDPWLKRQFANSVSRQARARPKRGGALEINRDVRRKTTMHLAGDLIG